MKSKMGDQAKHIDDVEDAKRKREDEEDSDEGNHDKPKRSKRRSVLRRKPLPSYLFALEGMSDAMENLLAGKTSISFFEDITKDPFYDDYRREDDRRDFQGLHFPVSDPLSLRLFLTRTPRDDSEEEDGKDQPSRSRKKPNEPNKRLQSLATTRRERPN
eukprot:TRINITY_DN6705_c0_g1_i1.p1 TRINITY_DN6705_c0_g1~~TRINITY_DN6705_c0_g1_i1.p1  ORF type:complete len:159 (+),score=40.17 TRINITY_DN6705_c0_g1_i1:704-1180(+)